MANPAQSADAKSLLDRESELIAAMVQHCHALTRAASARVYNRSTVGEAAANRLHMETQVGAQTNAAEELLTLTRRIRELWVIGPLRRPGEGDVEAETSIRSEVSPAAQLVDARRVRQRQRMMGPHGTYQVTETGGPGPAPQPAQQPAQQPQPAQPSQPSQPSQASQRPHVPHQASQQTPTGAAATTASASASARAPAGGAAAPTVSLDEDVGNTN